MKTPSFLKNPIEVLYEDKQYIAFNKPANLLVIPTPQQEDNTLVNIVNFQYAQKKLKETLHPCHRLDRDTSGVILFAKGVPFQHRMMDLFKARQVKKEYIAIVQGNFKKTKGQLASKIKNFKAGRPILQDAVLNYELIEAFRDCSLLRVFPVTGRTNQIRIQFSEIGHPLVGDRKFSFARDYDVKFRRTALHAQRLEFVHPVTKKTISIKVNLPEDMEVFLARHRDQR